MSRRTNITRTNSVNRARLILICSMFMFGSIGILRRYIMLSSGVIASARGFLGMAFLWLLLEDKKVFSRVRKDRAALFCISGGLLGFNWILLFEAFRLTSVAVASICYYMAPVFIILASPFLFHERLTWKKMFCAVAAFTGVFFISGVWKTGLTNFQEISGVLLALGAGMLGAGATLINKKIYDVPAYERAIIQLGASALLVLAYVLFTREWQTGQWDLTSTGLLIVLGIVHTGIAYALYFGAMRDLPAQSVAVLSYIDPVVSVLLSALVLHEGLDMSGIAGAVLVIGAALVSEL